MDPVYGISKLYTWIRQNGKKFMRKSGFKFIHFGLGWGGGVEGTPWLPPPSTCHMKYLFKDRKILTTRWQRFFFVLSAHLVFPLKTKSGGVSSLQVLHWVRERERERVGGRSS
jgi:hypothetical protein